MKRNKTYKIRATNLVYEEMESELIIIDLLSGTYFLAKGDSVFVWNLFKDGITLQQLADLVSLRYEVGPEEELSLQNFLKFLQKNELVVESSADGSEKKVTKVASKKKKKLHLLEMEIFRDMEELLSLDPIHEVGEAGWPKAK